MNVLVLGGTRFLGRHIVEALASNGDRVVCFHRGETRSPLPAGVEERYGDRNVDLSIVAAERWDAIVDTSCQRPEQMERSLGLRTDRYVFISTVNVYADLSRRGITESAPTVEAFDPADEAASYGGNKAACERLLLRRYPREGLVLRPGLIVGKWDPTGRFTYWCSRLARGGRVLAPGDPSRPIQFIDAADIADFVTRAFANETTGTFTIVGPAAPMTMGQLLEVCASVAAARVAPAAEIFWADDTFLLERNVAQWTELPLWLAEPQYAGILELNNAKALAAGLHTRPAAQTIAAVLDWIENDPGAVQAGMTAEREAGLLDELTHRRDGYEVGQEDVT
ncbi:MAG: NAD-dependent epimerase/dehydratase family protein [Candidatus Eremiobacteraeota bacterium]|nr:NAD-dependent epimerase/dehydratase family protein [Candidatus Eremiobacteraeota bacterium]